MPTLKMYVSHFKRSGFYSDNFNNSLTRNYITTKMQKTTFRYVYGFLNCH